MRKNIDTGIVKLSVGAGKGGTAWLLLGMPAPLGPLTVYFR